jgi:hypothetical protein
MGLTRGRVAVGPQQGRKAFMIRTIRPLDRPDPGLERVAKANGFSLHAGVGCEGHQKEKVRAGMAREAALGHKRERLCRYIARPAVAIPRLSLSSTGKVIYTLKTPYRDGTTQVAFDRGGHPPWISSPGWRLWCLNRESISPATMASWLGAAIRQIIACVGQSRQPGAAKV